MNTTSNPTIFELQPSDFTVTDDGYSIALPSTIDCSFSTDHELMLPDEQLHSPTTTTFIFSTPPDTLYVHPPLDGINGRNLPVQTIIQNSTTTRTLSTLRTTVTTSRKNPPDQNDNLPAPEDDSFTEIAVAGKKAYIHGNLLPRNDMRMPQNNRSLHFASATYRCDATTDGGFTWVEPKAVEVEIWTERLNGRVELYRCGGTVEVGGWDGDDGTVERHPDGDGGWLQSSMKVEGRGYQYGRSDGLGNELMVYRSVDGSYGVEVDYVLFVDTWFLRDAFNGEKGRRWWFRARYSNGFDEHGRTVWRGWSPTVGWTTNTAPEPPRNLRLDA